MQPGAARSAHRALVCISGSLIKNYVQVCVCPRWYFTSHKKTISQDKPRFPLFPARARKRERERRRETFSSFYIITSCRSFVRNKTLPRSLIPTTWEREGGRGEGEKERKTKHTAGNKTYTHATHTHVRACARAHVHLSFSLTPELWRV